MEAFAAFLIFCQALGSVVGVVTAVWGEIAYMNALRDGRISHAEREHLRVIGHGLRFGMALILLASLGLVVIAHLLQATPQPALTSSYWVLTLLALLIISVSWALSRRRISFVCGSALIFTAWWFLLFLTSGQLPVATFGAMVAYYLVGGALFFALLHFSRMLFIQTFIQTKAS